MVAHLGDQPTSFLSVLFVDLHFHVLAGPDICDRLESQLVQTASDRQSLGIVYAGLEGDIDLSQEH